MNSRNTICLLFLLSCTCGCLSPSYHEDLSRSWVELKPNVEGFLDPGAYTESARRFIEKKHAHLAIRTYVCEGPFRQEIIPRQRRFRRVQISFRKCYTPERLRNRQSPITTRDIRVVIDSEAKVISCEISHKEPRKVTEQGQWELYDFLYGGTAE